MPSARWAVATATLKRCCHATQAVAPGRAVLATARCATANASASPSHVHNHHRQPGAPATAIAPQQAEEETARAVLPAGTALPAGGASGAQAGRGADSDAGTEGVVADGDDDEAGRSPPEKANRLALVCYAMSSAKPLRNPARPPLPVPDHSLAIPPDNLPRHLSLAGSADVAAPVAHLKVCSKES